MKPGSRRQTIHNHDAGKEAKCVPATNEDPLTASQISHSTSPLSVDLFTESGSTGSRHDCLDKKNDVEDISFSYKKAAGGIAEMFVKPSNDIGSKEGRVHKDCAQTEETVDNSLPAMKASDVRTEAVARQVTPIDVRHFGGVKRTYDEGQHVLSQKYHFDLTISSCPANNSTSEPQL
jgi:hypothetical protein